MNFDTDDLAVAAHKIWSLGRTTFLEKSGASDTYHHKFFARLQSAAGYSLILKHMVQQNIQSPFEFAQGCARSVKSIPVEYQFRNELLGFESKTHEKENLNAFVQYFTQALDDALMNIPMGFPPPEHKDAAPVHVSVQHNIEKFVDNLDTSYEWATSWQIVCNKYANIIERDANEYMKNSTVLSATVLEYLLHHHVAYEGRPSSLQLSIGLDLPRSSSVFNPTQNIKVDEYTMRKSLARVWEHILSSSKWDAECLTKGLQRVFTDDAAIAFSSKTRHNI